MPDYPSGIVSLEVGRELAAAGLQHDPQDWDVYWLEEQGGPFEGSKGAHLEEGDVWLPTLDECLGEIERRGYYYELCNSPFAPKESVHSCGVVHTTRFKSIRGGLTKYEAVEYAAMRPDAAGKALVWVLRRK